MADEINRIETRSKFGVPLSGSTGSGILMPKLKYRFRVAMLGGFGGEPESRIFTQNVQSVTRPKITYEEVMIDSYNSKSYVQGKHAWEQVTVTLRDDISNGVSKIVGAQVQRQLNHFQQTSPASGNDYKFDMQIEILDGVNAGASEVWFLEGCFLTNVDYSDSDYSANDPVQIILQVRYDNAGHYQGSNDVNGLVTGPLGGAFNPSVDLNDPSPLS
jgi:hypothetical protein